MKYLNYITSSLFMIMLFFCHSILAQDGLQTKAAVTPTGVKIKFAPYNHKDLVDGFTYGYKLHRKMIKDENGTDVDGELEYLGHIDDYNSEQWEILAFSNTVDGELIEAAKSLLQDLPIYVNDSVQFRMDTIDSPKLSHAYYKKNHDDNKYIVTLLLADQNFDIAKGLGLAYEDITAQNNVTYRYLVNLDLNPDSTIIAAFFDVNVTPSAGSNTPKQLEGKAGNLKVDLTWSLENMDEYTYYNIYRSEDGANNFIKVNDQPFIYMSQLENAPFASFKDSLPANFVPYQYYVKGISPFGYESPESETITVAGMPDPLAINVELANMSTDGTITWRVVNQFEETPADLSLLSRFDIYRSSGIQETQILVQTVNDVSERQVSLGTDIVDGYYFVRAVDTYGYEYSSTSFLFQGIDSIPPAKPVNLSGVLNKEGHVKLAWNANAENDLKGYKVFYSYGSAGPFTPITKTYLTTPDFISNLGTTHANDSIYYKVGALDVRDNLSELSDAITLRLPDLVGPSKPIITQLLPRPEGMRIGWALAKDSDVTKNVLQRKIKDATVWNDILTILPSENYPPLPLIDVEINPSNYVDTTKLQRRQYSYRLMAVDTDGNKSYSDIYTAKPYDDGKRGLIKNFNATVVPRGMNYNASGLAGGGISQNDLGNTNIGTHHLGNVTGTIKSDGYTVRLVWDYITENPTTLKDFTVYQKITIPAGAAPITAPQPPFILLKKIGKIEAYKVAVANGYQQYAYYLEGVKPFKYQDTGGSANISTGNVNFLSPIEYKIIANHTDGGFSNERIFILE